MWQISHNNLKLITYALIIPIRLSVELRQPLLELPICGLSEWLSNANWNWNLCPNAVSALSNFSPFNFRNFLSKSFGNTEVIESSKRGRSNDNQQWRRWFTMTMGKLISGSVALWRQCHENHFYCSSKLFLQIDKSPGDHTERNKTLNDVIVNWSSPKRIWKTWSFCTRLKRRQSTGFQ